MERLALEIFDKDGTGSVFQNIKERDAMICSNGTGSFNTLFTDSTGRFVDYATE